MGVASTLAALNAGQYATTFDVRATDDLLVAAKVGANQEGQSLGLNFVSPSGGILAGYVAVVSQGEARFDVKLAGTVVGRSGQTGLFPLVLGKVGTDEILGRAWVSLGKVGAQ